MTYKIDISEQAQMDLRGIYGYIAYNLSAPQNAAGQIIRLEESINSLETMPMRFRGYETEPWRSRGMRVMAVDNYVVLYIPDKEKKTVYIIRVIYKGRDIDAELEEHKKDHRLPENE